MSLNKVLLLGHLGANPELRYSQNQTAICSFTLATNESKPGPDGQYVDHTEWHNIVTFGKTAENCSKFLQKGRQAFVEGKIQTRKYQDKEGKDRYFTEILASNVRFIGGAQKQGQGEQTQYSSRGEMGGADMSSSPTPNLKPIGETVSFNDEDIPF